MKRAIFIILLALAAKAMAQQVRVTVQVIEVPHGELTKWTIGEKLTGRELHERAVKLAASGEAEVIDTCVLLARSGERAMAGSISERIYPTEFHPPELPGTFGPVNGKAYKPASYTAADRALFAFETRNAGTTMEIEPMTGKGGQLVDLRFTFDVVDRMDLETWIEFRDQWGDASMRMPIFGTKRITSSITQRAGSFELCNVFTPKAAEAPGVAMRQLLFVRCDVLRVPD